MKRFSLALAASAMIGFAGCADTPPQPDTTTTNTASVNDADASDAKSDEEVEVVADSPNKEAIKPTPDEPKAKSPEKISLTVKNIDELDKFVAQQNGKVVVVDLWATW